MIKSWNLISISLVVCVATVLRTFDLSRYSYISGTFVYLLQLMHLEKSITQHLVLVSWVNVVISICLVIIVYEILASIKQQKAAVIAALLMAISPNAVIAGRTLSGVTVMLFALVLFMAGIVWWQRSHAPIKVLGQVCATVCVLTIASALILQLPWQTIATLLSPMISLLAGIGYSGLPRGRQQVFLGVTLLYSFVCVGWLLHIVPTIPNTIREHRQELFILHQLVGNQVVQIRRTNSDGQVQLAPTYGFIAKALPPEHQVTVVSDSNLDWAKIVAIIDRPTSTLRVHPGMISVPLDRETLYVRFP